MIQPKDILVSIPAYDGRIETHCVGGLTSSMGLFAGITFVIGHAAVNLARNKIVHGFLKTKYEHLVCIDSDIGFTRQDFEFLLEGDEEAVVAEYARKVDTDDPNNFVKPGNAEFGLGFARIHRDVFKRIAALTLPNGQEQCQKFFYDGELAVDFFPTGASMEGSWFGEDHGFWHLARLADATVRIERRTRLAHYGRKVWHYDPALSTPAGAWFGNPQEESANAEKA
jgi:hypothetical protein